jgi:hypothetical protein
MSADPCTELDPRLIEQMRPPCELRWTVYDLLTGAPVEQTRCDKPADWIVRTTCTCGCQETNLLCAEHLPLASTPVFICGSCSRRGRLAALSTEPLR